MRVWVVLRWSVCVEAFRPACGKICCGIHWGRGSAYRKPSRFSRWILFTSGLGRRTLGICFWQMNMTCVRVGNGLISRILDLYSVFQIWRGRVIRSRPNSCPSRTSVLPWRRNWFKLKYAWILSRISLAYNVHQSFLIWSACRIWAPIECKQSGYDQSS